MAGMRAVRVARGTELVRDLYDRIGDFLRDQRLDPDPASYAVVHALFADPEGPLAQAVHALTDGGVRLTRKDIEALGREFQAAPVDKAVKQEAEGLVARTQFQVEGFEDMVTAMRAETAGFGRDLAASAEAISRTAGSTTLGEVARITGTMLERIHSAEARLASATREASELRQKLEEARDNARRDPLTALPNRRAFEEAFAAQAASGALLCVAVCDVDHFKSVNDRFGHAVGDRVLKAIGELLTQSCSGHLVARYGGEEFAVLFSGLDADKALATLDNARARVAAKRYKLRESDAPLGEITFSAGLTVALRGEALQPAFQRADRLLYAAKSAGRNRLHLG